MKDIKFLVRPNILALAPYSCARDEFKGEARVYLDANENPYDNGTNRYPDPLQQEVKKLLAPLKGVVTEQIFLGNGSDEAIDLVYRIFCRPGMDNVVAPAPTYGMYQVCADVNDIEYRAIPLKQDYQLDIDSMRMAIDVNTKVIWLCSPNNPTGNVFAKEDILWFLDNSNSIVVVDEAYIDFSDKATMVEMLEKYPNLIVLQTFSKAWGQAAIRLGIALASKEIIALFNKVKYPYNVNILTQKQAIKVLEDVKKKEQQVAEILEQRAILKDLLLSLTCVEEVYPSDANFLLVKVNDANGIYKFLQEKGIIVRNRNRVTLCQNCLRITVGTPIENAEIFNALKGL
ncbi:MAG: histidinol-phosphate transaminase [Bacteroidales bacterium]|nr:histidinol-phosphate transaminase [Bacteroidales bacterium]